MSVVVDRPLLSCRDLTKRFGGLVALDGLDLEIRQGDIFGVIGPNGSGKTTFFNVITGVFPTSSGRVEYDGVDITDWSPQRVCRAGITRTFQRSRVCLSLSIFDNLMIGNHTKLNQSLWFNLTARHRLRRQYEEMVERARTLMQFFDPTLAGHMDEPVGALPMIDRRRIEICRALVSGPRLLLLDEPSAGMTQAETQQLMENILEFKSGTSDLSIILIEHEMAAIKRASDRCAVLNFGRKICEGTYGEVVADDEVQEAYLGRE